MAETERRDFLESSTKGRGQKIRCPAEDDLFRASLGIGLEVQHIPAILLHGRHTDDRIQCLESGGIPAGGSRAAPVCIFFLPAANLCLQFAKQSATISLYVGAYAADMRDGGVGKRGNVSSGGLIAPRQARLSRAPPPLSPPVRPLPGNANSGSKHI